MSRWLAFALILTLAIAQRVTAQEKAPPSPVDRYHDPLPPGALTRLGYRQDHPGAAGHRKAPIAFSADGKLLATINGRMVLLWDVATRQVVRRLHGSDQQLIAVAFGPDNTVAALGHDKVRVWRLDDFAEVRSFAVRSNWAGMDFSPEGRYLALTSANPPGRNRIHVYDVTLGKELWSVEEEYPSVFFAHDGAALVASWHERAAKDTVSWVTIRDTKSGRTLRKTKLEGHLTAATDLSPDGKLLVGFSFLPHQEQDRWAMLLRLFDSESGKEVRPLARLISGDLKRARFSPDGKHVAALDPFRTISLYEVKSGNIVQTFDNDRDFFSYLAFSRDGRWLANDAHTPFLYDVHNGRQHRLVQGHNRYLKCLAFSADGKHLAAGSDGPEILVWDIARANVVGDIRLPGMFHERREQAPEQLAFAPDGRHLLVKKTDRTVSLFAPFQTDPQRDEEVAAFRQGGAVYGFSQDGKSLLWSVRGLDMFPHYPQGIGDGVPLGARVHWQQVLTKFGATLHNPALQQFETIAYIHPKPKNAKPVRLEDLFAFNDLQGAPRAPSMFRPVLLSGDGSVLLEQGYAQAGRPDTGRGMYWAHGGYRLMDTRTAAVLRDLPASAGQVSYPMLSHDGRMLVALAPTPGKFQVVLLEARSGQPRFRVDVADREHAALALSANGRWLACNKGQAKVAVVDLLAGETHEFAADETNVRVLQFSQDGRMLAAGQHNGTILLWDVQRLAREPAREDWTEGERGKLWTDLAGEGEVAFQAMLRLRRQPAAAAVLLKEKLRRHDTAQVVDKLMEKLGSEDFAIRRQATLDLEELGEAARPFLIELIKRDIPLEQRRRLDTALTKLGAPFSSAAGLRMLRAVEVLERLATPEAIGVLRELAQGPVGDPLGQEVQRALRRLGR